jgi:hypothetical protein
MLAAALVCAVHERISAAIDHALTLVNTIVSAPSVGLRNTVGLLRSRSTRVRSCSRRSCCARFLHPATVMQSIASVAHMSVEVLSHQACRGTAKASRPLIISSGNVSKSGARFHAMQSILDEHSCICFVLHGCYTQDM